MSDDDYLYYPVPSLAHLAPPSTGAVPPPSMPTGNQGEVSHYAKRPRAGEPGAPPTPQQIAWQHRYSGDSSVPLAQPAVPSPVPAVPIAGAMASHTDAEVMYAALRSKYNMIQWQKDMIERGFQQGTDPHAVAVAIRTKVREGRIWKLGNMAQQQGDRDHPIRSVRTASGLSRPGDSSETIVLLVTYGNPEIK